MKGVSCCGFLGLLLFNCCLLQTSGEASDPQSGDKLNTTGGTFPTYTTTNLSTIVDSGDSKTAQTTVGPSTTPAAIITKSDAARSTTSPTELVTTNKNTMTNTSAPSKQSVSFVNNAIGNVMGYHRTVSQTVEFDCNATGKPMPIVQWLKYNQAFEHVSYRILNREKRPLWRLKLQDLLLADSGNYSCVVSNGLSTVTRSFILAVKERKEMKKPVIKELTPGNISVKVGTNVQMSCKAATEFSDAVPYIRWEKHWKFILNKNGTNITFTKNIKEELHNERELRDKFSDSKYSISSAGNLLNIFEVKKIERTFNSKLEIKQVALADDAEYCCVAFNDIGFSKRYEFLHVFPAPKPSRFELAQLYSLKYGKDGSHSGLPLAVTVGLPVGLIVLLTIGLIWWREHEKINDTKDHITLLDIKKMREMGNFSSMEHMDKSSSHVANNESLSSHEESRESEDADENIPNDNDESQTLLGNGNHVIQINNVKDKPDDKKKAEYIPMHVISSERSETPRTARSSAMGSNEELEWEPVDLKLNESISSKN